MTNESRPTGKELAIVPLVDDAIEPDAESQDYMLWDDALEEFGRVDVDDFHTPNEFWPGSLHVTWGPREWPRFESGVPRSVGSIRGYVVAARALPSQAVFRSGLERVRAIRTVP